MATRDQWALTRVRRLYPDVKRVVDSTKPLKVNVKPCDIQGAKKKDPTSCALARAFVREADVDAAIIRAWVAYLIEGSVATRYLIPPSVQREIVSFDRHRDFRTGDYQISAVHKSIRLGTRGSHKRKGGGRKHLKPLIIKRSEGMR